MVISKIPLQTEDISRRIFTIRGHRVMLDADLAELYGVPTKRLNEAIKRNAVRFPEDFMFQLSREEVDSLRSQNATLKTGRGKHRKYFPFAFTEQGVAMLSSVLNSKRAIQVNIAIMRAFVLLRRMLLSHEELARKVDALERRYDAQFRVVFDAIRALMEPPKPPRRRIGF
jgi:phage regulator Rha-like protein